MGRLPLLPKLKLLVLRLKRLQLPKLKLHVLRLLALKQLVLRPRGLLLPTLLLLPLLRQRALRLLLLHRRHWSLGHCRLHCRCERLCRDTNQGSRQSHYEGCSCLGRTSCWRRGSKRSCCRGEGINIFQLKVWFQRWLQDFLDHQLELQPQPERPDRPDPCCSYPTDQLCGGRGPCLKQL